MRSLTRILWLLVGIGLGVYLALTLWLGFLGLADPYQLDYGEGIVLWFARELARGQSIYRLPGFPYASSNYPPVAMLLAATLTPIFGDGYVPGRLLNFASALIVAVLIYRIVRSETRNLWAAAGAALFFVGSPYIYDWVPLFRTDLIGLAFSFGGVYCIWQWERRQESESDNRSSFAPRGLLLASLSFFLLALYTKQTLFAAPAAALIAIFARSRRTALVFGFALAAIGGGVFLGIDLATSGGFAFGLVASNATVFLPDQLAQLLWNFVATFPVILILALAAWLSRVRKRRPGVIEWYAVTGFAAIALAGRVGAWENYFFEAIAVASVLLGYEISDSPKIPRAPARFPEFPRAAAVLLPILLLAQLILFWQGHDPRIAADLVAQDLPANQQLAALLANTNGPVISEDMGALVTAGKDVVYYTFQYSSLARSGKWDQSWELSSLRDGAFPVVILERGTREDVDHYRRFTREFVSALDHYYARAETIGKFEVYRPDPLQHTRSADFGGDIGMVGWSIHPEPDRAGTLQVQIVWQAERAMTRRFTAFVHLEKADGSKLAQKDSEPHGGDYPTTLWAPNEMVRETYALSTPGGLAQGPYLLRVGWYDTETHDRLAVPGSPDDTVLLTTVDAVQ